MCTWLLATAALAQDAPREEAPPPAPEEPSEPAEPAEEPPEAEDEVAEAPPPEAVGSVKPAGPPAPTAPAPHENLFQDPMWGVGVHLGSWAVPGAFPSSFPRLDLDSNGSRESATTVNKIRGDFMFGVEGYFYVDPTLRLGLQPTV